MLKLKERSVCSEIYIFAYYWWFRGLPSSGVPPIPLAT